MTLRTTLMAAVASVGLISAANAVPVTGQISLGGYVEAIGSTGVSAATGLDFVQSGSGSASIGTAGGLTSFGAGTGSFASLGACGSVGGGCGSIKDILSFSSSAPISSFLTLTNGGPAVSFDLTSIAGVTRVAPGNGPTSNSITVTANGTINFAGFDSTAGTFTLTAQGDNIVSFSATTLASNVPEPASLAILGGSLAALGLIRRKKA